MKTLVINGSPRKNGHAMTLANEITKYLKGEVRIIHTYYDDISPCMDCRYCWEHIGCCIDDGMQEVYRLLNEVDNIILVSPIYFSELTGQLLSFASRLQMIYASKKIHKDKAVYLKIKNTVLVISAGGHSINLEERAIESAKIILRHMNANLIGTVRTLHTNTVSAQDDIDALNRARELALKLNHINNHDF